MGFKDLIVFNNALLAKQGWRLLQQKEALWARVLKELYFSHCSFLDANKGASASWCWSSLMEGKDIIKRLWVMASREWENNRYLE